MSDALLNVVAELRKVRTSLHRALDPEIKAGKIANAAEASVTVQVAAGSPTFDAVFALPWDEMLEILGVAEVTVIVKRNWIVP